MQGMILEKRHINPQDNSVTMHIRGRFRHVQPNRVPTTRAIIFLKPTENHLSNNTMKKALSCGTLAGANGLQAPVLPWRLTCKRLQKKDVSNYAELQ